MYFSNMSKNFLYLFFLHKGKIKYNQHTLCVFLEYVVLCE